MHLTFAFLSLGLPEVCIVTGLMLILFLGPRLHKSVRGITRMPAEFLRGRRDNNPGEKPGPDNKSV
ncbi:MAG TPA: hypothetical protein DCP71_09630 [Verrucomicrobiales bacterium]|nr:hypothetical protein [Verrucomicrobiales bacterium]